VSAPANRWKLGLFVLSATAVGIAGFTWLGLHNLKRSSYPAMAYFDEALTGLEEGSPVKFRGVTIGTVSRIRVGPDKKHLAVEAALYDDYLKDLGFAPGVLGEAGPLPENLRAMVVMSWVTNTSFVQVDFFPDPPTGPQQLPFETPPNTMRTVPSTAKGLEDASRELFRELPAMAAAARELIQLLRSEVQSLRAPEVARSVERTLATLDATLTKADPQATLRSAESTLAEVRELVAELRSAVRGVGAAETAASVRAMADDVGGSVRRVADGGTALMTDLQRQLERFAAALASIERLADLLERDPSALLRGRGAPTRSPIEEKR
jgi:paraquat-inducible protein B